MEENSLFNQAMQSETFQKYVTLALIPISIVLILWGIFLSVSYNSFVKTAVEVDGVITDVSIWKHKRRDYLDAWITYTVNDVEYEYFYNNYKKGFLLNRRDYEGMSVKLLYDPSNPAKVQFPNRTPYAQSVIMIIAGVAAGVLYVVLIKRYGRIQY
ncbi:MAG: DUF3592 domain-containing protein [Oscillospiraceae bacterium]|nr:DUF3592 domain-containing protein [Oscillospiraceae bacterium]